MNGDILVNRAFTDVEVPCRASYGCLVLNEIFRKDLTTLSLSLVQPALPPYKDKFTTSYERILAFMKKEAERIHNGAFFEGMTSIRAILAAKAEENPHNDRKILRIYFARESEKRLARELSWLIHRAEDFSFPLVPVSTEEILEMTTGSTHGGIVAECGERTIPVLDENTPIRPNGFYVMIEGIEDPYNFGYAIRSLYAAGVDGIILPERNWMSASGVVARASAGASELIPLYTAAAVDAAVLFKKNGYRVVSADVRTDILLPDADLKKPIFLIVGGEKRGISRALLDRCDFAVKIPYGRDFNAALSAASAATILGYEVLRQNQ